MDAVITSTPGLLGGRPCFAGTRVPVQNLFDHLEADYSISGFLEQFPSVQREQVLAVLQTLRPNADQLAVEVTDEVTAR